MSVDLLLITWNRFHYLEKTLNHLLSSTEDFNIYWWDNGSTDGTRDMFHSTNDPRIIKKYASDRNVGQKIPTYWFFEHAVSRLVGKIDDDIILPHNWLGRLSEAIESIPNAGMLGGWVFLEEEWNEIKADKLKVEVCGVKILPRLSIQGHSFLGYRAVLKNYLNESALGFPIDQNQMTLDGYINGTLVPPIFLENMDDPRSINFVMPAKVGVDQLPFTYRKFKFKDLNEYAEWIRKDAITCLDRPYSRSVKILKIQRDKTLVGKIMSRLVGLNERMADIYWR